MQIRTVPTNLSPEAIATRNAAARVDYNDEATVNGARVAQTEWATTVRASSPDYEHDTDALRGWNEIVHEAAAELNVPARYHDVWCDGYVAEAEALSHGWVDMRRDPNHAMPGFLFLERY